MSEDAGTREQAVGHAGDRERTRSGPDGVTPLTSVYGYRVRSDVGFASLRAGDGTPLEIVEEPVGSEFADDPLLDWWGDQGSIVRLYQRERMYRVWIDQIGSFDVDPDVPSIRMNGDATGPRREARVFGLPLALCFMLRGDLALHAAAVDVDGSALLLAAPGLYGKSTLTGAFINAGYRALSEDQSCYRPHPTPAVVPGPALLRIRPDVYERLELANTRVVEQDPDRFYLVMDESIRGTTVPVPLRGVVFLRKSEDVTMIERVQMEAAFPDLWTLSFHLPSDEDRARCFGAIAHLAASVPVWNLYRPLRFDDLPALIDQIITTCLWP